MKFSLLSLIVVLTVAALSINGWIAGQRSVELSRHLTHLQNSIARLELTPDEIRTKIKEVQLDPTLQFHQRLEEFQTMQRIAAIDLGPEQPGLVIVRGVRGPRPEGRWSSNGLRAYKKISAYKIRIPADRSICLTAAINDKSGAITSVRKSIRLPVGEYLLGVKHSINPISYPPEVEVHVFQDGLDEPDVLTLPCDSSAYCIKRQGLVPFEKSCLMHRNQILSLEGHTFVDQNSVTKFVLEIYLEDDE